MTEDDSHSGDRELATAYLGELGEETARAAWGDLPGEERWRVVLAAVIFGRRSEELLAENPEVAGEAAVQRLLMRIMNDVVGELAEAEGMSPDEAGAFLAEISTRDRILEMNEVIESYESGSSPGSLDDTLRRVVESRDEKARWADHWSSG